MFSCCLFFKTRFFYLLILCLSVIPSLQAEIVPIDIQGELIDYRYSTSDHMISIDLKETASNVEDFNSMILLGDAFLLYSFAREGEGSVLGRRGQVHTHRIYTDPAPIDLRELQGYRPGSSDRLELTAIIQVPFMGDTIQLATNILTLQGSRAPVDNLDYAEELAYLGCQSGSQDGTLITNKAYVPLKRDQAIRLQSGNTKLVYKQAGHAPVEAYFTPVNYRGDTLPGQPNQRIAEAVNVHFQAPVSERYTEGKLFLVDSNSSSTSFTTTQSVENFLQNGALVVKMKHIDERFNNGIYKAHLALNACRLQNETPVSKTLVCSKALRAPGSDLPNVGHVVAYLNLPKDRENIEVMLEYYNQDPWQGAANQYFEFMSVELQGEWRARIKPYQIRFNKRDGSISENLARFGQSFQNGRGLYLTPALPNGLRYHAISAGKFFAKPFEITFNPFEHSLNSINRTCVVMNDGGAGPASLNTFHKNGYQGSQYRHPDLWDAASPINIQSFKEKVQFLFDDRFDTNRHQAFYAEHATQPHPHPRHNYRCENHYTYYYGVSAGGQAGQQDLAPKHEILNYLHNARFDGLKDLIDMTRWMFQGHKAKHARAAGRDENGIVTAERFLNHYGDNFGLSHRYWAWASALNRDDDYLASPAYQRVHNLMQQNLQAINCFGYNWTFYEARTWLPKEERVNEAFAAKVDSQHYFRVSSIQDAALHVGINPEAIMAMTERLLTEHSSSAYSTFRKWAEQAQAAPGARGVYARDFEPAAGIALHLSMKHDLGTLERNVVHNIVNAIIDTIPVSGQDAFRLEKNALYDGRHQFPESDWRRIEQWAHANHSAGYNEEFMYGLRTFYRRDNNGNIIMERDANGNPTNIPDEFRTALGYAADVWTQELANEAVVVMFLPVIEQFSEFMIDAATLRAFMEEALQWRYSITRNGEPGQMKGFNQPLRIMATEVERVEIEFDPVYSTYPYIVQRERIAIPRTLGTSVATVMTSLDNNQAGILATALTVPEIALLVLNNFDHQAWNRDPNGGIDQNAYFEKSKGLHLGNAQFLNLSGYSS